MAQRSELKVSKCQIDEQGKFELKVSTSNTHLEFERKYVIDLHEGKNLLGRSEKCEKAKKVCHMIVIKLQLEKNYYIMKVLSN